MHFELSIINGKIVFDIIRAHRAGCIDIVQNAYLAHAQGQSVNPDSYFLRFPDKPDCRIIALPAYLGDGFHVAGLKWIASYPGNVQRGFPRASAVLVLNNYENGYPFAILESSIISAARTAASAALAAYWLTGRSRRAHSLGIVGTGFIARYVYDFLVDTGWEIDDVEHVMKGNTSPHLTEQLTGSRSFVTGTLAEIMLGRRSVNRSRPILFSPFGLGILDVAVGKWVYDRAVPAGQDQCLSDFFYETAR